MQLAPFFVPFVPFVPFVVPIFPLAYRDYHGPAKAHRPNSPPRQAQAFRAQRSSLHFRAFRVVRGSHLPVGLS